MKKSLTEYLSVLTNADVDIFEEILSKKYRKFIKFFTLVKDYTEYISKLEYELSDSDTLCVKIVFTKSVSFDDKQEMINGWRDIGYQVDSKISGKKMRLQIRYAEK